MCSSPRSDLSANVSDAPRVGRMRDASDEFAHRLSRPFVQLGQAAFRFVIPPSCPLCHQDVELDRQDSFGRTIAPHLCHQCALDMRPQPNRCCPRCGLPIGPYARADDGCPFCRTQSFRFCRVIRLGLYNDLLRTACIRAKSATQSPLAAALANLFWLQERDALDAEQIDLVVSVPRHWTRNLAQPHHAAETISRTLARRLSKPHRPGLLRKIKWTPDQSDLSAANRKLNLKDAFAVRSRPQSMAGQSVLLVDDILTTGTTANECSRALLKAGAAKVIVAVVAVVPPNSR